MLKRLCIFLGIAVALALTAWGVLTLLNRRAASDGARGPGGGQAEVIPTPVQLPQGSENRNDQVTQVVQKRRLTKEEYEQELIEQFAKDFAARLATYSSQNFGDNIGELLPFTQGAAKAYLEKLKLDNQGLKDEYVGVTSRAVAVTVEHGLTRDEHVVVVGLRKQEDRNNEESVYNQNLLLTIHKVNSDFFVSTISWGEIF